PGRPQEPERAHLCPVQSLTGPPTDRLFHSFQADTSLCLQETEYCLDVLFNGNEHNPLVFQEEGDFISLPVEWRRRLNPSRDRSGRPR
ncbi:MAG: hypothetical protein ACRD1R_21740, partial [Acidobacteriota bacterium]